MAFINDLLNGDFMPHGHCLLWRTDLLLLHVGGDTLTFIAYMLIPIALIRLVRARDDLRFDWMFLLFAGFIFFCGATHILGIINVWHGYYYIHGIIKSMTGIISILTAISLWYLLPQAISLPGKRAMEAKIVELMRAEHELAASNQRLEAEVKKRTAQLEKMATTDELTELLNRREIMRLLELEIARADRQGTALSIMMLDLDHFKAINDSYGHQAGDRALKNAAENFKQQLRKTDFIGRIGGEEFAILLPGCQSDKAHLLADICRDAIKNIDTAASGYEFKLTASFGVTSAELSGYHLTKLIEDADTAMYQAKQQGRDKVQFFQG